MRQESKTPLFDRLANEFVEATFIDGVSWDEIEAAQDAWTPAMKQLLDRFIAAQVPRDKWPEHLHWNWKMKAMIPPSSMKKQ